MFRRSLALAGAALLLSLSLGVSAFAAPGDPGYPPAEVPAVDGDVFAPGEDVPFQGGGFTPGETIQISVTVEPAALRGAGFFASPAAARVRAAADLQTVVADAAGRFAAKVPVSFVGVVTITAVGLTSGHSVSLKIVVAPGGVLPTTSSGTASTTSSSSTSGTTSTTTSTTSTGVVAAGSDDDGLAYTGASIAGPLVVGAGALICGLALLFFGTRMAIRRKHTPSS